MENWREIFNYSLIAKSDDKHNYKEVCIVNYEDIEDNVLSPITNLVLNSVVKIFDSNANLIINYPKKILKPIPLIAYIYAEMKSKSVLVFSAGNMNNKKDLIRIHNDNYYSLGIINQWHNSVNIHEQYPMGYIKNKNELSYRFFLPHASSEYKKKLNKNIINNENPQIILMGNSSLTSIIKTITNISIDNENSKINTDFDLDIGCIIFENADKYFSSNYYAEYFIKWLNDNISPDTKIIFHFSNHNLNYINDIKKLTKSKVISFNGGVIKNNKILIDSSLNYFKKTNNMDILRRYNLDDEEDYYQNSKIILDENKLYNGNTDYFRYAARKLSEYINDDEISPYSLYYNAQKLFIDLNNITINPAFLKIQVKTYDGYSYVTVPQFIDLFYNSLKYESKNNRLYLNRYLTLLNQYYYELKKRKRYGEPKSYNDIGKDYRILEVIENRSKYFENDNDITIGTFLNTEPGILNKKIEKYPNVEAKYMGNLLKENKDSSNINLLLAGFIPPKFISELYKNYSKIFILNYDGYNRKKIEQQLESIENPPISEERKAMNYFFELYDYLGINKDNAFVKNYKKRLMEETGPSDKAFYSIGESKINSDIINEYNKIKKTRPSNELFYSRGKSKINIDKNNKYNEIDRDTEINDYNKINEYNEIEEIETYENYLNIIKKIEDKINKNETESKIIPNTKYKYPQDLKTIELELLIPNTDKIITKIVPERNKYLHFKDYGALEEAFEIKSKDLSKGDYVIILDDEVSFVDLFIEIFNLEENIDKNLADYWKDKLSNFVEENYLSPNEFYELYKQEGGQMGINTVKNWLKGNNIAPRDYKNDLYYLSKIMNDDFLLDNIDIMGEEFRKIKSLHIAMGKNLKSIMKSIIVEDFSLNYDLLSLEEQKMHNIIKNSVYQVLDKK